MVKNCLHCDCTLFILLLQVTVFYVSCWYHVYRWYHSLKFQVMGTCTIRNYHFWNYFHQINIRLASVPKRNPFLLTTIKEFSHRSGISWDCFGICLRKPTTMQAPTYHEKAETNLVNMVVGSSFLFKDVLFSLLFGEDSQFQPPTRSFFSNCFSFAITSHGLRESHRFLGIIWYRGRCRKCSLPIVQQWCLPGEGGTRETDPYISYYPPWN